MKTTKIEQKEIVKNTTPCSRRTIPLFILYSLMLLFISGVGWICFIDVDLWSTQTVVEDEKISLEVADNFTLLLSDVIRFHKLEANYIGPLGTPSAGASYRPNESGVWLIKEPSKGLPRIWCTIKIHFLKPEQESFRFISEERSYFLTVLGCGNRSDETTLDRLKTRDGLSMRAILESLEKHSTH